MDQYLQALEHMKDMPIVRFFSQFLSQSKLSPVMDSFHNALSLKSPGALAKELFFWAILLVIVTFAVDQAFYWTKPGQVDRARDTWNGLSVRLTALGQGVRGFSSRTKSSSKGGSSFGRR